MDEEVEAKEQAEGTAETVASTETSESQTEFQVPDGQRLIDVSEYDSLINTRNTHKGIAPIGHAAINSGFKTEADIQEARAVMDRLRENNIDPAKLSTLFSPEATKEPEPDERFTKLEDRFEKLESESAVSRAIPDHRDAMTKAQDIRDSSIKGLLGDDASSKDTALFGALFDQKAGQQLYPEGHALRDRELSPLTQDRANATVEAIRKELNLEAAKEVVKTGKAATKPSGGSRDGQGGAETSEKGPTDPQDMSKEQRIKAANEILAKTRKGGATSSLEG